MPQEKTLVETSSKNTLKAARLLKNSEVCQDFGRDSLARKDSGVAGDGKTSIV